MSNPYDWITSIPIGVEAEKEWRRLMDDFVANENWFPAELPTLRWLTPSEYEDAMKLNEPFRPYKIVRPEHDDE